ncbi:MAG: acyltransferase [Proteobacteria bacterium]|nr:acyltransferase [Pseudomonadota bacterium]MBU1417774.1 acyltransferase [Pseudomonadota bacterium]
MEFERATQSKAELRAALKKIRRRPHGNVNKGKLLLSPEVFTTAGCETNVVISPFSILDCTGSIHIGPWCNFGARSRIYTHDHCHQGKVPLLTLQEKYGVIWQDKYIGRDVWIHENGIVLYQASILPDGFILGAGSVLTKNPGPYEIWAGVPAKKIADRKDLSPTEIAACFQRPQFKLQEYLHLEQLEDTNF